MGPFSIYSGSVLVGYSALERGDPPMGVAYGQFQPTDEYRAIQQECRTNHSSQSTLVLSAQTRAGKVIPCIAVAILDYSENLEPDCIEVNVLGIPYPLYGELFPQQVTAYEQQFTRPL